MTTTTTTIDQLYTERYPRSRELFERQRRITPGGYTHSARVLTPFPLFITANRGSHKWDADGFEYVDYWLGHGAMLLGHAHPDVVEAVTRQAPNGFHAGGETELGIEWAELVQSMVPSAEQVRFVASGGEATQMALRVARAHTGKDRILKFEANFHGWHDVAAVAVSPPYDIPWSSGVPQGVQDATIHVPYNDLDAVRQALDQHDDIAAILLEPGGAFDDTVPSDPAFLRGLRDLATSKRVVLIFDEVVTGFRYAKGGAQEFFGVTPDLTALGKVVGGGLPCGALVGKTDVMEVMAWKPDPEWQRYHMVPHPGTWNANPGVASVGIATLQVVRDTDAVDRANQQTKKLIAGTNEVFQRLGIEGFAYGRTSVFKTCKGTPPRILDGDFSNREEDSQQLLNGWGAAAMPIRKAMLLEGIDLMRKDGFMSAAHTDDDIEKTVQAWERALVRLRDERTVG